MLRVLRFAPDLSVSELVPADLPERLREPGTVWVDLTSPTDSEFDSIAEVFGWHPLAIEDCRVETHLPKVDDYRDHLLIILHGIDLTAGSSEFATREVEIFLGHDYLVTHHSEHLAATGQLEERCLANPGLAQRGPAYLLFLMLDLMSGKYLPYLDGLDGKIDRVEEALLGRPSRDTVQEIYNLKRNVLALRRVAMPQLEVLRRLGRGEFEVVPKDALVYFLDIYDDLFRITQATDSYRELLTEAHNAYLSALSNEMNQVMKILTVFASILLPLTFLVGVWGMNFRHMPEIRWRFGYAFAWAVMLSAAAALAWFFKRRRWW